MHLHKRAKSASPVKRVAGMLLLMLLASTTTGVFGQAPASPPSPFLNFRSPEVFNGVPAYWDQTTCAVCDPPADASVANPRNPVTGYETNCALRKSSQDAILLQSLKYIRNYNVASRTNYGGYRTGANVSAPQYYLTTTAGMGDVYAGRNPSYDANPGVHTWFNLRGTKDKATDPYTRDLDNSTIIYEELHAWTSVESFLSHLLVGQEIAAGLQATIWAYNYLVIGPVNQTTRAFMEAVLSFSPGTNFWMTRWRGPTATSRPPPSFIGFVFNDVIDYYSLPGSPQLPECRGSLVRLPAEVRTRPVYMWLNATIYPSAVEAYERDMRDLVSQMRRMRCVISFFSQQQPAPGADDDDAGALPHYNSQLYTIGMFFNSWECMDAALLYPSGSTHRSRVKAVLDKMQNLDIVFFSGLPGNVGVGSERYIRRALRQRSDRMGTIRMRSRSREAGWMLNEFIDIDGKRPASWTPPPACVLAFANCSAAPWSTFE